MQTQSWYVTVAMLLGVTLVPPLSAATPDQPYHRTPNCVDGNCIPNRAVAGYNVTRWRPWPGGEPSQNTAIPPVGIQLPRVSVPTREKELEMPVKPSESGDSSATLPSPNDNSNGGSVSPPEFRNVIPKKPVEEPLPGNSNLQRGPLFPGAMPTANVEPLLLSKRPAPLRSMPTTSPLRNVPAEEPPAMLKIRPASNSQSGLMPEMVPWNDEDKNPIVRQTARIMGNQVQQTISLHEARLPDANESNALTIRVHHESPARTELQKPAVGTIRMEAKPRSSASAEPTAHENAWRSPVAAAPARLPNIEARPLLPTVQTEPVSHGTTVSSSLRGLSQGNPLRR